MAESKNDPYKDQFGGFADKLKTSPVNTPIQKVVPVESTKTVQEEDVPKAQLNVWIPKDLLRRMKQYGLDTNLSLKDITIKAIEEHLAR